MTDDDGGGYALHSWVDESMHVDGDNGLYILAAVVCAADGCDPIRNALRELLDQGQPKLHWGTESPERRKKIIGVVAEVDMAAVVVVGAPLAKKKQERARAVCMETLVVHLAAMDVTKRPAGGACRTGSTPPWCGSAPDTGRAPSTT